MVILTVEVLVSADDSSVIESSKHVMVCGAQNLETIWGRLGWFWKCLWLLQATFLSLQCHCSCTWHVQVTNSHRKHPLLHMVCRMHSMAALSRVAAVQLKSHQRAIHEFLDVTARRIGVLASVTVTRAVSRVQNLLQFLVITEISVEVEQYR